MILILIFLLNFKNFINMILILIFLLNFKNLK